MPKKCHKVKPAPKEKNNVLIPLKAGVLYVVVATAIRSGVTFDDLYRARPMEFDMVQGDILMSIGEAERDLRWGYAVTYHRFLHLATNTLRWVVWDKDKFHQLKGLADTKNLRGYPKAP